MAMEFLAARLADGVLLLHLSFVVFVMAGGWLTRRWPRLAWVHLPAVAWAAWIEWSGGVCPLTPLEDRLRGRSVEPAGAQDFLERLLTPLLYPDWLTREWQLVLGALVLVVNGAAYAWVLTRARPAAPR
jgi:hypothetical protein